VVDMLACVSGALPLETVATLRSAMEDHRRAERATLELVKTLCESAAFQKAAYPADVGPPSLRLYDAGAPGDVAAPSVAGMRSDLAVAVNLNDESEYEGGELVLEMGGFEKRWRGAAGAWIVHPVDARARVESVSAGRRCLLTFEVQSFVRDPAKRQVLRDLSSVLGSLEDHELVGPPAALLRRCYDDLLRHWAENGPFSVA
jgi:PKHD-type hydroxylase